MSEDFVKMPLTQGKYAIVDLDDYEILKQWKWRVNENGYASRQVLRYGKRTHTLMHRFIVNTPDGMETDHINRNKLDNRKVNLRCVPHSLNERNKPPGVNNTSGYRGVSWDKSRNKWRAQTSHNGKHINLGRYDTREEAAAAHEEWLQANIPIVAVVPTPE